MAGNRDDEGEVDVRVVLGIVWRRRLIVATCIAVFLALTISYLHIARYKYAVTMEIAPVAPSSGGQSSVLGALSSIAGISKISGGGDNFQIVIDGMKSEAAANALSTDPALMRRIFANEWDEQTQTWREPPSNTRWLTQAIKNALGLPIRPWQPPSAMRLYEYIQEQVNVIQDPKSSVVTLESDDANPQLAGDVLIALNQAVDDMLRARALKRADGYIGYITTTLRQTTIDEYRQSLLENLNEQTKQRMMAAASNVAFASTQFGAPVISPNPVSPATTFLLIFTVLIGGLVGSGVALAVERRRLVHVGRYSSVGEAFVRDDLTSPAGNRP